MIVFVRHLLPEIVTHTDNQKKKEQEKKKKTQRIDMGSRL